MFRRSKSLKQREWLTEDLAQIQRLFPGAELIEAIDTPFDITVAAPSAATAPSPHPRPSKTTLIAHDSWLVTHLSRSPL